MSAEIDELLASFGVDEKTFLDALRRSPNARGYLLGSVSEVLLRSHLESLGYVVERIKEKWTGPKLHHGDFYVRKGKRGWFVLESKGLKSNSEKWHKTRSAPPGGRELQRWLEGKRSGEISAWWRDVPPGRKGRILEAGSFNRCKVLETHFVAGTAGRSGRAIATPRKDEFHAVALDLFLKTGRHEFVFAASAALAPARAHPEHLKQNYLLDILIPGVDSAPQLPAPWTRHFDAVFDRLTGPVRESERQVDERLPGGRAAGVDLDLDDDA